MNSYLISNYKGKYTLQAEIDKSTGDFCRDKDGNLDNYSDIWIDCYGGGKVFHYGKNILLFCSSSLGKGHNVLKNIYSEIIGSIDKFIIVKTLENGKESRTFDYRQMYSEIYENGIIFEIEDTDAEVLFKFKAKDLDFLSPYIKPKTSCADRSPFSQKVLRKIINKGKEKYVMPNDKMKEYKEITSQISREDLSVYNKINKGFIAHICVKTHKDNLTFSNTMKLSGLKPKEYFHSIGMFDEYLNYIKEYLKENL